MVTLPDWTFSEVMTQVNAFLDNDAIKGLFLTVVALGLATRIIATVRRVFTSG